jgi:hypothetical protein
MREAAVNCVAGKIIFNPSLFRLMIEVRDKIVVNARSIGVFLSDEQQF